MSTGDEGPRLLPSILDRLTDPESGGSSWQRGYSVEQLRDAVRRDLEDLLNTHQAAFVPEGFPELQRSVFTYGMPDASSLSELYARSEREVPLLIQAVIEHSEPRLRQVRARMIPDPDPHMRAFRVRVQIDARLALDPAPEVGFETILNLAVGHATVSVADDEAGR